MPKSRRITISLTEEEAKEMEKMMGDGGYRSKSDIARLAIRKMFDEERERRTLAVRGLTMTLEGGRSQLDKKTLKKIKEALGVY